MNAASLTQLPIECANTSLTVTTPTPLMNRFLGVISHKINLMYFSPRGPINLQLWLWHGVLWKVLQSWRLYQQWKKRLWRRTDVLCLSYVKKQVRLVVLSKHLQTNLNQSNLCMFIVGQKVFIKSDGRTSTTRMFLILVKPARLYRLWREICP